MSYGKKSQTFTGQKEWVLSGGYFKLLSAANDCDVELLREGTPVWVADAVTAGIFQRIKFDTVRINSSVSQLVEFITAPDEGGSDVFSGSVAVTSAESPKGSAHTPAAAVAGAASAQILAANPVRKYLAIQNQSATEDCYVNTAGAAATVGSGSFKIRPGETWEPGVAPTGAITAIRGAATNVSLHVIEA